MSKTIALALLIAVSVVACSSRPVRNVEYDPVVTSGTPATMDALRQAIVRAGTGLGWVMTPAKEGEIEGRLSLRGHVAVVVVRYDTKTFSIRYKDSTALDYADGQIHKNYNGWVQNLDRGIRASLAAL